MVMGVLEGFANVSVPIIRMFGVTAALQGLPGVRTHQYNVDYEPEPCLVGDVIPYVGIGDMHGPSSTGKSHLAISLGMALATGRPFLGAYPIAVRCGEERMKRDEIGVTAYVASEGRQGFQRRLHIAFADLNAEDKDRLRTKGINGAPIYEISASNLSNEKQFNDFRNTLRSFKKEVESAAHGVRLDLVVIDTLSGVYTFGDENSSAQAQEAMNRFAGLAEELNVFVLLVSHPSKNGIKKFPRGSLIFFTAADVVMTVERHSNNKTGLLSFPKVREEERPDKVRFQLSPVELPNGVGGVVAKQCVDEIESVKPLRKQRQSDESILFEVIEMQLLIDHVKISGKGATTYELVSKEIVCSNFCERLSQSVSDNTKIDYFRRAYRELSKRGKIEEMKQTVGRRSVPYIRVLETGANSKDANEEPEI